MDLFIIITFTLRIIIYMYFILVNAYIAFSPLNYQLILFLLLLLLLLLFNFLFLLLLLVFYYLHHHSDVINCLVFYFVYFCFFLSLVFTL
jgi:hypothetical protein